MNFFKILFTLILITFSFQLFAGSTSESVETQLPLTKQTAAELVKAKSHSKILSVDKKTEDGNTIFVVKTITKNGKVKIFSLDAQTGLQLN